MSFSLDYFNRNRDSVLKHMNRLYAALKEMGLQNDMKKILDITKQVGNESFQIVVVGEFSRGKSTFINALLGKRILPSSARPTTTLLNVITHSAEPFIKIHYRDGKRPAQMIDEGEFKTLVAPKEPMQGDKESELAFQKQVEHFQTISHAEIGHPLAFCQDGVQIIDTPGTNDLDPAREQITNSIIPKSDVAILILSAVKILSESEVSFLRDRILANDIQKVFVAINFKDELQSQHEIDQVYRFAETHLKKILLEPKIFMVAAKQALNARRKASGEELKTARGRMIPVWDLNDTGFIELETALADFLQYERGAVKLRKPVIRAEKLIDEILEKQIDVQIHALNLKLEDLQEKIESFMPKLHRVRDLGKEALKKLTIELQTQGQELSKWYENELQAHANLAYKKFDDNVYMDINQISRKIEDAIAPKERDLHVKKKEKMTAAVEQSIDRVSTAVNKEWFQLEGDFKSLLSSGSGPSDLLPSLITVEGKKQPSIFIEIFDELGDAWDKNTTFLGALAIGVGFLATAVIGGITSLFMAGWSWLTGENEKTKFKRNLQAQFDQSKNQKLTSFKKEWKGLVDAVYKQYQDIINKNVQQMELQLQELLNNTKLEEKDIEKKRIQLERRAALLKSIRKDLYSLEAELTEPHRDKVVLTR
ncbi:dynamin family protein [Neobacillus cucumis]|uniref:dynamin family protein n=1 Tax=Neobacillus cucumis TaxID=1740721 RepID=UPI00203DB8DD|nr:dynamin family protein [Neobacillus cucumis]MCM3729124.1 dynamin family protein [Neobacillus cucumis]